MKISVVIAYYNRRELILKTLSEITKTVVKDIEVVIVDDDSSPEHSLDDIVNNYWFPIKLVKISAWDRYWVKDSCVCIDVGAAAATGDVLIIQQPECCYVGDLLKDVQDNWHPGEAVAYSCYTLNPQDTEKFIKDESIEYGDQQEPFPNPERATSGWINHPTIVATGFHYAMAISAHDWAVIGGMDRDFAYGFAACDMNLLEDIWSYGIQLVIPAPFTYPFVVHMFHECTYHNSEVKPLIDLNIEVFHKKFVERKKYFGLLHTLGIGPVGKPLVMRY